jgi:hypothetical protein
MAYRVTIIPTIAEIQENTDWMPDRVRHDEIHPILRGLLRVVHIFYKSSFICVGTVTVSMIRRPFLR